MKQKMKMSKSDILKRIMDFFRVMILAVFILVIGFTSMAQENTQDHNEQVTIVGSYDPSINEAYKINIKPNANEIEIQNQEFSFDFLKIKQETNISLNPIKPVSLRTGTKTKKFDNYLKLGFGSRLSPYLDFYHSSGDKGKYSLNTNIFHYSSFNDIPDYSPSSFSKTHAMLDYSKFIDDHIVDIGFKYGLNTNHYYGFKPDDYPALDIPEDELKQMFNLIDFKVGLASAYRKDSKLHHKLGIGAYYYFDRFKTSELFAELDFDLYKSFDLVDMLDYQNIGIDGSIQFYSNTDSVNSSTEYYVNVKPYFTAKYGVFSFNAGLNFGFLGDSATSFHFWPVLELNMNIMPGALSVYAGIDGKLEKQSYLSLTTENPFLSSVSTLGWLNEKMNVYGGLRASFSQIVGLDIKLGWKSFENMAFFVNVPEIGAPSIFPVGPLNKFKTIYDNGSVFYLDAELSVVVGKDLKLWLGAAYNNYSLDSLEHAYHKPQLLARLGGSYLIAKKVNLSAELYYNAKRYALDASSPVPTQVELDSYIDLNVEVVYQINTNLSAFINGTNLLNKNYERFYYYPVQGLQIMGGIMYKF